MDRRERQVESKRSVDSSDAVDVRGPVVPVVMILGPACRFGSGNKTHFTHLLTNHSGNNPAEYISFILQLIFSLRRIPAGAMRIKLRTIRGCQRAKLADIPPPREYPIRSKPPLSSVDSSFVGSSGVSQRRGEEVRTKRIWVL